MALWRTETHTYSTHTNTYTITPSALLRLPWVPIEFEIDGFCDWCCETGGAFKSANLHCLLQDNSPHWTREYVRNCHHHLTRVDNDDDKWCLHSTYQVFRFNHHICLTTRVDSKRSPCTETTISVVVKKRFLGVHPQISSSETDWCDWCFLLCTILIRSH